MPSLFEIQTRLACYYVRLLEYLDVAHLDGKRKPSDVLDEFEQEMAPDPAFSSLGGGTRAGAMYGFSVAWGGPSVARPAGTRACHLA
jgi:hypothetical protein